MTVGGGSPEVFFCGSTALRSLTAFDRGAYTSVTVVAFRERWLDIKLEDKQILLVEDDADIVSTIKAALKESGATVAVASDGNAAVEAVNGNPPDLVILDMMLPKRSGFLVLEKLKPKRSKGSKPFVIMVTGNSGSRHKAYAQSLGVDDYINKPFRMERLLESIDKLLGQ